MFDLTKRYRTRDGREVRLYANDGRQPHPLHGAYLSERGWIVSAWTAEGMYWQEGKTPVPSDLDIIGEIKERGNQEVLVRALSRALHHCGITEEYNAIERLRDELRAGI